MSIHTLIAATFLLLALTVPAHATVVLPAAAETTPIPFGKKHTDDPAIWINLLHPNQSRILGTSKQAPTPPKFGGLGVYDLDGTEHQFIAGGKLNSVDIAYSQMTPHGLHDLAFASNRTDDSLDVYQMSISGQVELVGHLPLLDGEGALVPTYGLCLASRAAGLEAFLPTKTGVVHRYAIKTWPELRATWLASYDLKQRLSPEDDAFVQAVVEKSLAAAGELDELDEELAERHTLEACVFDSLRDQVYVGMENFGIWALPLEFSTPAGGQATLLQKILGSWAELPATEPNSTTPRLSDDVEGLDRFVAGGRDYLLISSQGLSEFAIFDLGKKQLVANFAVAHDHDAVSETDGLAVYHAYLTPKWPQGILVVHDDRNSDASGEELMANYKIVDFRQVLAVLGLPH